MLSSDDTARRERMRTLRARVFGHGLPGVLEPVEELDGDEPQASSAEPLQQAPRSKAEDKTG